MKSKIIIIIIAILSVGIMLCPAMATTFTMDKCFTGRENIPSGTSCLDMDATNPPTINWTSTEVSQSGNQGGWGRNSSNVDIVGKVGASYDNLCTLTYKNVGQIGGRQMNATVTLQNVNFETLNGSHARENGYYGQTLYAHDLTYITIGSKSQDETNLTMAVNITWADNGETVQLPFYLGISDIDIHNAPYYEGVSFKSGFTGEIKAWKNFRKDFSGDTVKSNNSMYTNGDECWYEAGVVATTNTGRFTVTYHENCSSITNFNISSQFLSDSADINEPTKDVKQSSVNGGDTINYTIKHTLPTWLEGMYSMYTGYTIKDELDKNVEPYNPKNLEKCVTVLNGNGKDITSSGTLTYTNHVLKWVAKKSWATSESTYNGQTITMKIKAKADEVEDDTTAYNTGTVVINGLSKYDTNTVKTKIKGSDGRKTKLSAPSEAKPGDVITVKEKVTATSAPSKVRFWLDDFEDQAVTIEDCSTKSAKTYTYVTELSIPSDTELGVHYIYAEVYYLGENIIDKKKISIIGDSCYYEGLRYLPANERQQSYIKLAADSRWCYGVYNEKLTKAWGEQDSNTTKVPLDGTDN